MLRLHPELKGVPVYPTQLMTAVSDLMLFLLQLGYICSQHLMELFLSCWFWRINHFV